MWNLLARLPGIDIPKDGCGGTNGLFWITASRHPTTYERSYARTGHYDGAPSQRSNYDLLPGHKVNAILFNGTTATGLRFTPRADLFSVNGTAPGPRTVSASKEVILAAGAIHTPQILQLSGIGDARLLARAGISPVVVDLPGVGQRFQDQGYVGGMAWAWGNTSAIPRPPKELIDSVPRVPGPVGFNYNAVARLGMPVVAPDSFEKIAADYENQDPAAYLPEDTHPDVIKGYAAWQKLHAKLLRKKNVRAEPSHMFHDSVCRTQCIHLRPK